MQVQWTVTVPCNAACKELQMNCMCYLTASGMRTQRSIYCIQVCQLAQHAYHSVHSIACLAQRAQHSMHITACTAQERSPAEPIQVAECCGQTCQPAQHAQHSTACTAQHQNAHQQIPDQVAECKLAAHTHYYPQHLSIQTGR